MDEGNAERWRSTVGFEGHYEVSDHGRVQSVERQVRWGATGTKRLPSAILQPYSGSGCQRISLRRDGRNYMRSVHVLVAEAFIGPRPTPLHDCCHDDGNPCNNRLDNVRWDTKSANKQDQIRHGRLPQLNKSECSLGHAYAGPNLYLYRGARNCLACRHAYNERQEYRSGFDFKVFADQRYDEILSGEWPRSRKPRPRRPSAQRPCRSACPQGHAYQGANIYTWNGVISCRACRRARTERPRRPASFNWEARANEIYVVLTTST